MAEEKELRPIATRVLYEDDEVRIWDQRIGAGETLGRHPIDVEFHDGTGGELGDAITLPRSQRGEALFVRKGHVETAHNRGDGFRAVLVELKRNDKAGPAES
jgi:hypothetical protein